MDIKLLKINDIKPYDKNPRKNDPAVDAVANSIKEFGFKQPIVIDKDNVIVAGHTRYRAAKQLKLTDVPCLMADDLTDEQIRAYRLADNKTAELAEWDFDLLNIELDNIFDIDMSLFGFLDEPEEAEPVEDDFDVEANIPDEPVAKLGDIWKLGRHRLMCGDSTDGGAVALLMNGVRANLYLSDPPYGVNIVQNKKVGGDKLVTFGSVGGNNIVKAKEYAKIIGDDTTETAQKAYEIIREFSDNQIIFGGNYFTDFLYPSACWVVWDKENTGNFADVEMAWTSFDEGAKLYKWLWNGMSRKGDHKTEGSTRVHPTQKPVGMLSEILKDFTDKGNIILDTFLGSGSTLIACEQADRTCYGMELSEAYVDVIIARYEQFTGNKAVLLNGET